MEQVNEFLSRTILTLGDATLTYGDLILVPLLLLIFYAVAKWIGNLIVRRMMEADVSPDLIHLVQRVYLVIVLAILAVTVLQLLEVPLGAFAFVSGAVAIGVGFGAQNIINNFISGWILLWERPIRINDFLEVGGAMGTVEAINTRSTRIRRTDGVHMLIPNSFLLENTVVNWTLVDKRTRTSVRVGVAYGSPVKLVKQLILQATEEDEHILDSPAPLVIFDSFGDNALEFEVYFWALAAGEKDLRSIRSDLRFRIDELFKDNNITIAFPQRDVHIDSVKPLEVKLVKDN